MRPQIATRRCATGPGPVVKPVAAPAVVLYGRPGCHLCDDARELLERIRLEVPFALEERDITRDDDLHRRYLERIPVVTVDGEEAFELILDEGEVRQRLESPAR
jgi:glutaredoxin